MDSHWINHLARGRMNYNDQHNEAGNHTLDLNLPLSNSDDDQDNAQPFDCVPNLIAQGHANFNIGGPNCTQGHTNFMMTPDHHHILQPPPPPPASPPPSTMNAYTLIDVPESRARRELGTGSSNSGAGASIRRSRQRLFTDPNKRCSNYNCNTNDTPMWRRGPLGRNTLCNACGIKYRKDKQRMAREAVGGRFRD